MAKSKRGGKKYISPIQTSKKPNSPAEIYFLKEVHYFANKFKLFPMIIQKDDRIWGSARISEMVGGDVKCILTYNSKRLLEWSKEGVTHLVLHELAHIKKKAYSSDLGTEQAEYIAEKTALKWMKKYRRKEYDVFIKTELIEYWKNFKKSKSKKLIPYLKAFIRIKEYKDADDDYRKSRNA